MIHLTERFSSNSPVEECKSFSEFTIFANLKSQFRAIPSLGAIGEDIATGSEIDSFFVKDVAIWLKPIRDSEYYLDKSSNLGDLIVYFLSQVSEIDKIYLLKESENVFHIWSVISEKTQLIKKAIYEHERKLIHYFKENLYFDFHINVLEDIEHIKDTGAFLIFERK